MRNKENKKREKVEQNALIDLTADTSPQVKRRRRAEGQTRCLRNFCIPIGLMMNLYSTQLAMAATTTMQTM